VVRHVTSISLRIAARPGGKMNKIISLTTFVLPAMALFVSSALAQVSATSQEPKLTANDLAAIRRARADSAKAALEIRLDRREYMPRELLRVTVAVSNPTNDSLSVYDPFDGHATCLDVSGWVGLDPQDPWVTTSPDSGCYAWNPTARTITLTPGQRIERVLPSSESSFGPPKPQVSSGRYRMSFCYGTAPQTCAHAEFVVLEPIFRGSAVVKLAEPLHIKNPRTGVETLRPRYLHSYLLEAGGKRYIVLARAAISDSRVYPNIDQELTHGTASLLREYDRLAEVDISANSLEITADQYEYPTVAWREGNGQRRAIWVSPDRSKIQEVR
jgi:hypothetical protein